LLHYGHNGQVDALCAWLLILAVLPLAAAWGWERTRGPWTRHRVGPIIGAGLAVLPLVLLSGCAPSSSLTEKALDSKIFSRVQIIGSRGIGLGQFNKPRSVAVDRADNLYVVDMTGRVQKFNAQGVFQSFWQMEDSPKGKPKGMATDNQGNLLVVEPHFARVNCFSPAGVLLSQWGQNGTNAGQLAFPRAIAVNSHDELYVSEYNLAERVQRFAGKAHQFLNGFGRGGTGNGEFDRAEGLGTDAQDRVYVADSCNHRIQIFSREGKFLRTHGSPGRGPGQFSYPYDVRIDDAGRQYVCEFGNSRIQIFDANDQPLETLGQTGSEPGQFNNPWSIALDSVGNLYVADSANHRVQKLIARHPQPARSKPLG
jgi:DNA-binding beta-propeller fold protein YncE